MQKGLHGNTGEPPASTRNMVRRIDHTQTIRANWVNVVIQISVKKRATSKVVSKSRETEDKEKGEGSLSIFILPIERWEISPMKASK